MAGTTTQTNQTTQQDGQQVQQQTPQIQQNQQTTQQDGQQVQTPQFDYDKLAQIIAGKQTVTEESVLRGYFKQQGLSKEQMEQAIAAFKQQQEANQPDVAALQSQVTQAQSATQQAQIQNAATLAAVELGLDVKSIPYVLKMADFSQVVGQDGTINTETVKAALNKVLEDVPALKPTETVGTGFVQVGTPGNTQQVGGMNAQTAIQPGRVATKRWNRFNN